MLAGFDVDVVDDAAVVVIDLIELFAVVIDDGDYFDDDVIADFYYDVIEDLNFHSLMGTIHVFHYYN